MPSPLPSSWASALNISANATAALLAGDSDPAPAVFQCSHTFATDDTATFQQDIRGTPRVASELRPATAHNLPAPQPGTSWASLMTSAQYYGLGALGLLTFNELTRSSWPRKVTQIRLPPLGRLPVLGWLVPILKTDDVQLLRIVGLDAFVLLRYIRLCLRICR